MISYMKRTKRALKNKTIRGMLLQPFRRRDKSSDIEKQHTRSVDASGVVSARTISDDINPAIHIPFNTENTYIEFESVAIIAHVYYEDLIPSLLNYIKNIPVKSGLFISTNTEEKRTSILKAIGVDHNFLEVEVRIAPNRGRDIAPKLITFRDVYTKYPAFLHIHSKKSLHGGDAYAGWRDYLLHSLMGTPEIAQSNLSILSRPNVGIVYPEHASYVKPFINWGYDFNIASDLLSKIGVNLELNNILEFPSGSMFWGRSEAISKLLSLDLSFNDFSEELGQIDGTMAHAIERCILYIAESSGFIWHRTSAAPDQTNLTEAGQCQFKPLLFSQYDQGTKYASSNMVLPIPVTPCGEGRPRLNLMVPSINAAHIFGGISTALELFADIAKAGEFDLRVLITDATQDGELPKSLQEFDLQRIGSEIRKTQTIVDCSDRSIGMLEITSADVFVATIWWTAVNAYRIHDYQKMIYGSAPRVIYLIQDFEPGFYEWSSHYALAESTYHHTEDTIAIFNSEELEAYFSRRYNFQYRCVLPYRPNASISRSLISAPRERNILFYARPTVSQNCFEIGMEGIKLWSRQNPVQANKWTIYCIGETVPAHSTDGLNHVVATGKMSHEEYAKLFSTSSIGLSLMVSPQPSYPLLEMAYAGIRTITNTYECKNTSVRTSNIVEIKSISPESIAEAIEEQVAKLECLIGTVTPIRCQIKDIETVTPIYSPELVNSHIWVM